MISRTEMTYCPGMSIGQEPQPVVGVVLRGGREGPRLGGGNRRTRDVRESWAAGSVGPLMPPPPVCGEVGDDRTVLWPQPPPGGRGHLIGGHRPEPVEEGVDEGGVAVERQVWLNRSARSS